jgi:hypothetical protein
MLALAALACEACFSLIAAPLLKRLSPAAPSDAGPQIGDPVQAPGPAARHHRRVVYALDARPGLGATR